VSQISVTAEETGRTCPYCGFPLKQGIAAERCDDCGAIHHEDCWNDGGGCAVVGCGGGHAGDSARTRVMPPMPTSPSRQNPPPPVRPDATRSPAGSSGSDGIRSKIALAAIGGVLAGALIGGGLTYFLNDKSDLQDQLAASQTANEKAQNEQVGSGAKIAALGATVKELRSQNTDLQGQLNVSDAQFAKASAEVQAAAAAAESAATTTTSGSSPSIASGSYIAQLGSFPGRPNAEKRLLRMTSTGIPAQIILGDDYPGLTDGYWVVAVGPTDKATAGAYAADGIAAGVGDAFVNNVEE